jgi:hypothetical protein
VCMWHSRPSSISSSSGPLHLMLQVLYNNGFQDYNFKWSLHSFRASSFTHSNIQLLFFNTPHCYLKSNTLQLNFKELWILY